MSKKDINQIKNKKEDSHQPKQSLVIKLMTKLSILNSKKKSKENTDQIKPAALVTQPKKPVKLYADYTDEDWAILEAQKQEAIQKIEKLEAIHNQKLKEQERIDNMEKEFLDYKAANPSDFDQFQRKAGDVNIPTNYNNFNEKFKDKPQEFNIIREKTKGIIETEVTPNIIQYFKDTFDIDLGNIDLSYKRINTTLAEHREHTYAQIYLQGKIDNNTLELSSKAFQAIHNYRRLSNKTINFDSVVMINAMTHEALHKLFNLDNRLEIDKGANVENRLISVPIREGMVEYYARQVTTTSLKNNYKVTEHNLDTATHLLNNSGTYDDFVRNYDNYLIKMAQKLKSYDTQNLYQDETKALKHVQKLAASFFLSSDNKINDMAKQLNMPGILEIENEK